MLNKIVSSDSQSILLTQANFQQQNTMPEPTKKVINLTKYFFEFRYMLYEVSLLEISTAISRKKNWSFISVTVL